ncbi:hypothetical protein [Runella sp.]
MTHLYDIGNSVYELSQHNQTNFTNISDYAEIKVKLMREPYL